MREAYLKKMADGDYRLSAVGPDGASGEVLVQSVSQEFVRRYAKYFGYSLIVDWAML